MAEEGTEDQQKAAQNYMLDDLWARIRNFLNDLNEKGEKRDFGRVDKPNKLKFLDACQNLDVAKKGILSEA